MCSQYSPLSEYPYEHTLATVISLSPRARASRLGVDDSSTCVARLAGGHMAHGSGNRPRRAAAASPSVLWLAFPSPATWKIVMPCACCPRARATPRTHLFPRTHHSPAGLLDLPSVTPNGFVSASVFDVLWVFNCKECSLIDKQPSASPLNRRQRYT